MDNLVIKQWLQKIYLSIVTALHICESIQKLQQIDCTRETIPTQVTTTLLTIVSYQQQLN